MTVEIKKICELLNNSKRIAIVGISRNPDKISRIISNFLVKQGYEVYGVNPAFENAEGIKVFSRLTEIPYNIDIVNVFREPNEIPQIIPDVLKIKPKALWLQQGIRNDIAIEPIVNAGIITIQDECIMVWYNKCKNYFLQ